MSYRPKPLDRLAGVDLADLVCLQLWVAAEVQEHVRVAETYLDQVRRIPRDQDRFGESLTGDTAVESELVALPARVIVHGLLRGVSHC